MHTCVFHVHDLSFQHFGCDIRDRQLAMANLCGCDAESCIRPNRSATDDGDVATST
jgi:hypothetical protein